MISLLSCRAARARAAPLDASRASGLAGDSLGDHHAVRTSRVAGNPPTRSC